MNFDEAIASHEKWKIKLKDYIKSESTHAVIDPLVVEKDNLCDFGKWIYNEGLKYKSWSQYEKLITEHSKFHKYAAEIIKFKNHGFKDKAIDLMSFDSSYMQASFSCVNLIKELKELSFQTSEFQKILKSEGGIDVNHVFELFMTSELYNIIQVILIEKENENFISNLIYYCYIFRFENKIQDLMNHELFPEQILLNIIYYNYGRWIITNNDAIDYFKQAMLYINPMKSIQLLLSTNILELDLYLALHLVGNLDMKHIDIFFSKIPNMEQLLISLVKLFQSVDEHEMRKFFWKNPDVYGYILMVMATFKNRDSISNFISKNEENIQLLDKLIVLKESIKNQTYTKKEKNPNKIISQDRLLSIIHQIKHFNNIKDVVNILYSQGFFINEDEKDIVYNILTDPFLKKHILHHLPKVELNVKLEVNFE